MPSSATITSFYSFAALTVIKSAEVNTNFSTWRGHNLPVDPNTSTAATTRTYDLGASDHAWRYIYGQNLNLYGETTSASPAAGSYAIYVKAADGKAYIKNSAGTESSMGGGGGGIVLNWLKTGGNSPTSDVYSNDAVELFQSGLAQELYCVFKVPDSYAAPSPLKIKIVNTTPDTSGTILFTAVSTLLAKNTTAFTSTTNQRTSTNVAATVSATANAITETILDITSSTGTINSVAVAAGDNIKVKLTRGTDTATSDVRFHPNIYEVTLS